jgi:hypothetical protein
MAAPRIRAGTHTASDMTSTYDVAAFPIQADQRNYLWRVVTPTEMAREFDAQTEGGLDGTRRNIGYWNGSIYLMACTPLMHEYVRQTLFPTNGVNEALTIVIYTVKRGWVCLQVDGHLNELSEVGENHPQARFLEAVRLIDFDNGVLNTGGGFSSGFSSGFDLGGIPT